ncbi:MAG TPA: trypsin-like peptidase domain-containing protein [Gammaproteobacteria bacterium]|nr:trypsin-like peptidase domain-containing protein [Gammaproteobacteria bacterium]
MRKATRHVIQLLVLTLTLCSLSACVSGIATADTQSTNANTSASAPSGLLAYERNTVNIVHQYENSVVAINVTVRGKRVNPLKGLPPQMRQFFHQFGGPMTQPQRHTERAAGSGFVVDAKGQILTNYHVIANALHNDSTKLVSNASVTVQFPGGKPLPVDVVGVDQSYDLALLQLKNPDKLPKDAKAIPLADSDKVQVGQKAIAIGNPFLLQSTVTQGIVSAVNREQAAKASGVPIPYIQTDAAINPGNSGGPLLDSQGKVMGVNDEILAPNGTFIGVGLAIPSNLVKENLSKMKAGGFIKKAMIGIVVVSLKDYPRKIRHELGLPDHGLMVVKVKPNGPGAKAGLSGAQFTANAGGRKWPAGGDILLKADGEQLNQASQLQKIVFSKQAGTTVSLQVLHDGKKKTVKVTLAVLKKQQAQSQ